MTTTDRKIRTPRERAHDALDLEARKYDRVAKRVAKLEEELKPLRAERDSLVQRVAFLAGDPLLDHDVATATLVSVGLEPEPDLIDELEAGDPRPDLDDPETDLTQLDDELELEPDEEPSK